LLSVRAWVEGFAEWYNTENRHSGIKYVTPNQRHCGQADAIRAIRQQTYKQAVLLNPQRWHKGSRDWKQPEVVEVNHPRRMQSKAA
jgi:putative transposase